jgi:hypothetical protein
MRKTSQLVEDLQQEFKMSKARALIKLLKGKFTHSLTPEIKRVQSLLRRDMGVEQQQSFIKQIAQIRRAASSPRIPTTMWIIPKRTCFLIERNNKWEKEILSQENLAQFTKVPRAFLYRALSNIVDRHKDRDITIRLDNKAWIKEFHARRKESSPF